MKKILMVATNVDQIGDQQTGLWLSEFVEPATEWTHAGFEVTGASIKGGKIPIDPNSYSNELPRVWDGVMEPIHDTAKLTDINPDDYDAIFFCGGHGAMLDFPNNNEISALLDHFKQNEKLIGAICHGPAAFVGNKDVNDSSIVKGIKITGYSNEEEQGTGLAEAVPFLLEDELKEAGASYESGGPEAEHVVVDQNFITGQNPQSTHRIAEIFKEHLS
ncbi:glutamine amidotransferase [Halobacillus andaensis]|uniref:Glutamine amidotransferase n=1 Tax=Halobacillus andaensis TaxID=1176239 RepID=A0A917B619_HALAA|nr:type 1 glutamine amidotransferase domain-containing protein [Halobacillus andaensis]MBP2004474.1 putative intracellular protease/amidase [Halobacillus andaensis]GGF21355.1 glutamine amidotransferase [Halobacillus andaensis]